MPTLTIPCIQCGNCCRVGGGCDWLKWSRHVAAIQGGTHEKGARYPYEFEGTCPELQENGQCGVVLKVLSGEWDDILAPHAKDYMNQYLKGVCTAPELREKQ